MTHTTPGQDQAASATPVQSAGAVPGWFVPAFGGGGQRTRRIALWPLMRRQWLLLLLAPVVLGAVALAYVMQAPRIYESATLLAPAESEDSKGLLESLTGQLRSVAPLMGGMGENTQRERSLAVMRSRGFALKFIDDNNLRPLLFPKLWDETQQKWRQGAPSDDDTFKVFDRNVRFLSEDRKTGFVRLAMRSRDPERSAEWATKYVNQLNAHMRALASRDANRNLEFLNNELSRTTTIGTQQALYRLVENQLNKKMLANVREEYAFETLDAPSRAHPSNFVSPKRALLVALAMAAGLLIGFVIALMRDWRHVE